MNEVNARCLEDQREWLEYFYREMYQKIGFGPRQNEYYMDQILSRLDKRVQIYLSDRGATVLDVGCAMGYGSNRLASAFPTVQVYGLEVDPYAAEGGQRLFPSIDFIYEKHGEIKEHYDVILSSHCLEHYLDPLDILLDLLSKADRYCIILAPYMEYPLGKTHLATISDSIFPERIILNSCVYDRIQKEIFAGDPNYSRTKNILVVYQRRSEPSPTAYILNSGEA